ncbi:MAG: hypothetical protein Q8L39_15815, partial [Burkholderiales bacterium]|nr:hypothetical protein [Burkholderiales bacterium]
MPVGLVLAATPDQQAPRRAAANNLVLEAQGTGVSRVQVQVDAHDLASPLRFDFEAAKGEVIGGLAVPPGSRRTFTVTSFDARGEATHSGSAV